MQAISLDALVTVTGGGGCPVSNESDVPVKVTPGTRKGTSFKFSGPTETLAPKGRTRIDGEFFSEADGMGQFNPATCPNGGWEYRNVNTHGDAHRSMVPKQL